MRLSAFNSSDSFLGLPSLVFSAYSQSQSFSTSYEPSIFVNGACGDEIIQANQGEECDDGAGSSTCNSNCKKIEPQTNTNDQKSSSPNYAKQTVILVVVLMAVCALCLIFGVLGCVFVYWRRSKYVYKELEEMRATVRKEKEILKRK